MPRKAIVVLLWLALAVNRPALGQAPTPTGQDRGWPKIDLNVLVVDKSGQPQAPLDRSAFHVFENGAERPIESVTAGDAPVSPALLIDISGSTYGNRDTVGSAVTAIIRALPQGSEVMAVLFSERAFMDLPFTPADPAPLAFLDHLESRGRTALYDALVATANYVAGKARYPKRALVVLSDGSDNDSTLNLEQTLHRIEQEPPSAPAIYFVEMPEPRAKRLEKRHARAAVRLVNSYCGGLALVPDPKEDAASLGTRIAALIRSQYVFTFVAAGAAPDDKFRKLEVRVDHANLEAHAVSGYFPRTP